MDVKKRLTDMVFIKGLVVRMSLPNWFGHFSYKEVQFKMFWPSVKTSYLPAENIHESPILISGWLLVGDHKQGHYHWLNLCYMYNCRNELFV